MSDRGLVFIVDDDALSAEMLRELLEVEGYEVAHAQSGAHALEAIGVAEPNLVLLDAHLPDTNAFELLDQLKKSESARDVPVILMTTLDDADIRVQELESGDDLIVKPIDAREVLARIERQVTVSKVRTALRESDAEFRSVMESAIDAIISATPRARFDLGTAPRRRCLDSLRTRSSVSRSS